MVHMPHDRVSGSHLPTHYVSLWVMISKICSQNSQKWHSHRGKWDGALEGESSIAPGLSQIIAWVHMPHDRVSGSHLPTHYVSLWVMISKICSQNSQKWHSHRGKWDGALEGESSIAPGLSQIIARVHIPHDRVSGSHLPTYYMSLWVMISKICSQNSQKWHSHRGKWDDALEGESSIAPGLSQIIARVHMPHDRVTRYKSSTNPLCVTLGHDIQDL